MIAFFKAQNFSLYGFLAGLFAIALQIQVTLFASTDYLGLRVNLADFILPFLGVFILISLLSKRSAWPQWSGTFGYWAIALLSSVIALACVNGYFTLGHWSSWAVINKTLGWFILMAYIGAGAWIAMNSPKSIFEIFAAVFVAFICFTGIYEMVTHFISWEIGELTLPIIFKATEGFMFNRNAFAFLLLTGMVLICEAFLPDMKNSKVKPALFYCFWVITPFFILMNGSRTLWMLLIPLFAVFLFRNKKQFLKHALPVFLLGSLLLPVVFPTNFSFAMRPFYQTMIVFEDPESVQQLQQQHHIRQDHDSLRIRNFNDGLALLKQNPVTGAGLGALVEHQKDKYGEVLSVMDNTLLWVLVEMGPLGLFSFLLVYIVMVHTLYKQREQSPLHNAAFYMLLAFGFFSLFHEILYTRFMWFILGMTLAMPIARQDGSKAAA